MIFTVLLYFLPLSASLQDICSITQHVSNMIRTLTVMIRAKRNHGINVTASRWGWGRREGMKVTLQMFITTFGFVSSKKEEEIM